MSHPEKFSHRYSFDPSYQMDLAQLLAIAPPQPPQDFAAFWQVRYQAVLGLNTAPALSPCELNFAGYKSYFISYCSTDDVEIRGWLLVPEDEKVWRGLVVGHGYGGRDAPDLSIALEGAALLFPCFRGLGLSHVEGLSSQPYHHVLHEIEHRERYVLGGCVEDLWCAVNALQALFPQIAGRVAYSGVSFGGGVGALAAPWDARIKRVHLHVPTFGCYPLRLALPCVGSGEAVRIYQRHHTFNIMDTLAYYDAASAAQFLRIPSLVAAALFDPAVPPPGQFAIYNAMPADLRQLVVLEAGHFDYEGKDVALLGMYQTTVNFFKDL